MLGDDHHLAVGLVALQPVDPVRRDAARLQQMLQPAVLLQDLQETLGVALVGGAEDRLVRLVDDLTMPRTLDDLELVEAEVAVLAHGIHPSQANAG